MKTWLKILIVFITFGASAAIAYAGTILTQYAIPCSLFSGAFGALGSAITGFSPKATN